MKVIIYQEQQKITVKNISIPNIDKLAKLLDESQSTEMEMKDLQLYNFRITSTRGLMRDDDDVENEDLEKEIEEGINWKQETVN